jgi:hypothetical protein
MRTLIFCMTHLKNETDGKLLRIWQEMIEYQNTFPFDLLIVDSASPLPVRKWLLWQHEWRLTTIDDFEHLIIGGPRNIIHFTNALGHPFHDGMREASGSDRAMMMGFQTAICSGYDRVVYLEMDLLFARPLQDAFDLMIRPAACLPLIGHGKFPENGLFIADCEHMKAIDFIERYNWRGPCSPEGELRQWRIYGDDVQLLPFKGCRGCVTKPEDLKMMFPNGMDWITHANIPTLQAFLWQNNFPHLAEMLA